MRMPRESPTAKDVGIAVNLFRIPAIGHLVHDDLNDFRAFARNASHALGINVNMFDQDDRHGFFSR